MRLSFTWLAAAGLAAALSVPAAAQDYPSVNIRFGHSIPSTTTSGLADGWVAQEVAKRSNGKVKINTPAILGHEGAGTVTEVGPTVKHLKVGDRVCVEPGIPDPNSRATRLGLYNLDPAVQF